MKKLPIAVLTMASLTLSGCIDNNYDLSDIDKTTQINVNDLTLPINMDVVTLSDIIDTDGSEIKIVNYNGKNVYAVSQTGEFESDDIEINGFTAIAKDIQSFKSKFRLLPTSRDTRNDVKTEVVSTYEMITSETQDIDISAKSLDESIISIDKIGCLPSKIRMTFDAKDLTFATSLKFKILEVNFIKGLQLAVPSNCSYDPASGLLVIANLDCPNKQAAIDFIIEGIDFNTIGAKIENQDLDIHQTVSLKDAELEAQSTLSTGEALIPECEIVINTDIEPITASSFTGVIKYSISGDGLNISPINLSDLPDFLSDQETNLKLVNPQLYLGVNNPLASSNLSFKTGLEIISVRGADETTYSLDANQTVSVGTDKGSGPYNFVLSPSMPVSPLDSYKNDLKHVGYSSLSNILSGEGLPSQIKINLIDPMLPQQKAENLPLSSKLPAIKGSYNFFAPLSLDAASKIVYTKTEDGWGDDELGKLTITGITLTADVTNATYLDAKFTVVPLYKENYDDEYEMAKPIPGIEGETVLRGDASDQTVRIELNGEIKNLDGVKFTAVVNPVSTEPMAPEQTITLKNIKVTVNGYYLTDFEDK